MKHMIYPRDQLGQHKPKSYLRGNILKQLQSRMVYIWYSTPTKYHL